MDDTTEKVSPGAIALANWSADRLKWSELQAITATTPALVMKDATGRRGLRLCVEGTLADINRVNLPSSTAFLGHLIDGNAIVTTILAVGDTGELVAQSYARFCGIAIGAYTYSNASGGVTHSALAVGLFDLPSNRKR